MSQLAQPAELITFHEDQFYLSVSRQSVSVITPEFTNWIKQTHEMALKLVGEQSRMYPATFYNRFNSVEDVDLENAVFLTAETVEKFNLPSKREEFEESIKKVNETCSYSLPIQLKTIPKGVYLKKHYVGPYMHLGRVWEELKTELSEKFGEIYEEAPYPSWEEHPNHEILMKEVPKDEELISDLFTRLIEKK